MNFTDQIKPFLWHIHDDGSASITLNKSDNYKKALFKTREKEGFEGSGDDWEALAKGFVDRICPDMKQIIEYDSEHLMFCAYSKDILALKCFITEFKVACENDALISDIFSSVVPEPPITQADIQAMFNKIINGDNEGE